MPRTVASCRMTLSFCGWQEIIHFGSFRVLLTDKAAVEDSPNSFLFGLLKHFSLSDDIQDLLVLIFRQRIWLLPLVQVGGLDGPAGLQPETV